MHTRDGWPELPRGWVVTTLGEILEPSAEKVDPLAIGKTPYVGLEHIQKGTGVLSHFGYSDDVKSTKAVFRRGDLLYGKLRPYLNKVWVAEFDGVCSTDILVFPRSRHLSADFLRFRLLSTDLVDYATQNMTGVQHPRVSFGALQHFPVALPPRAEQRRIIAKIEALFSELDAGMAALDKAKAQLQRYRQAVLKAAFSGELTRQWREAHKDEPEPASALVQRVLEKRRAEWEADNAHERRVPPSAPHAQQLPGLPDGWVWAELGQICETASGGTPSRKEPAYFGGAIPWVKSGELHDGPITSAEEYITETGLNSSSAKLMPKGTLLVALYGATAGRLGILEIEAATNQAICAVFTPSDLDRDYLFWHLLHSRDDLLGARVGGAQPNISQRILRHLMVAVPPFVEQHLIVTEIERRLSLAEATDEAVIGGLRQSERLRHSILKTAVDGQLVPQDPSDEPATLLLARIRKERAKPKGDGEAGEGAQEGEMKQPEQTRALYEVLTEAGARLTPEDLLNKAGFTVETIEEFYEELRRELTGGRIRETRSQANQVYLEAVPNEA